MRLNHPDLPKLISINLGMFSLCGRNNDPVTYLRMKSNNQSNDSIEIDLPSLSSIINVDGKSFSYYHTVELRSKWSLYVDSVCRYPKSGNLDSSLLFCINSRDISLEYFQ